MALILWRAAASVALLVALCTAVCYFSFFVWEPVSVHRTEALGMAVVCTVFNAVVVHHHVTQPPHPKFLLLPKRWWSIRTHLVTGVIEITASVAGLVASAVFGASVAPYIRFAAPAGIIHALTALYQTELVFGAKIIMRPAYYCVGYMHLLAAVASACAPERESRLLTQYMVLCIFTWCRVYMTLFRAINIAMPVVYSLSITLAGFTTGTVVLGPLGILIFVAFLSLSAVLWRWSADIDLYGTEWEELTRERVRSQLFDATAMASWKGLPPNASEKESEAAAARAFARLDKDGSGLLDASEALQLMSSMRVHPTVRRAMETALTHSGGGVDFQRFLRAVWNLGVKTGYEEPSLAELQAMTTPRQQARAVFDSIDLDHSGVLESFELAELLVGWGCPDNEVELYLQHVDTNKDGMIDFEDEFFPKMVHIWSFGFENVLLLKATEAERKGWHATDPDTPRKARVSVGTPRVSVGAARVSVGGSKRKDA